MRKNETIQVRDYNIELISNGAEDFDNIVLCFHGFNGDKWGDAYSGLKEKAKNSLVCSFDSCGHGKSVVKSEDMRLDLILEEMDAVVRFLQNIDADKPIIFVAVSYGAYRVMQYLIKYRPNIKKVFYVNPAFRILSVLERLKEFKYLELKEGDMIPMKRSLNKFMKKEFLDDLYEHDLYSFDSDVSYETDIIVGRKDTLIPLDDILEIAKKYHYEITYVDDEHCFENKENWNVVVDRIKEIV